MFAEPEQGQGSILGDETGHESNRNALGRSDHAGAVDQGSEQGR